MTTALERLLARPTRTSTLTFPYDPSVADELTAARVALLAADDGDTDARAEVDRLEAEMVTVRFDMAGIGPDRVEALKAAHPADRRAPLVNGRRPTVDHAGFTAALLAEVVTAITFSDDPDHPIVDVTAGQVGDILARLSIDDQVDLHVEALRLDNDGTMLADVS